MIKVIISLSGTQKQERKAERVLPLLEKRVKKDDLYFLLTLAVYSL